VSRSTVRGLPETTLACFLHPAANVALRTLGRLLYSMVLEYWRYWLSEPEGHFRHQCHAVIADLRHLQGYLARLGREQERLSLEPFEARLSRKCPRPLPADPEDCRRPGKRPGRTAGTWRDQAQSARPSTGGGRLPSYGVPTSRTAREKGFRAPGEEALTGLSGGSGRRDSLAAGLRSELPRGAWPFAESSSSAAAPPGLLPPRPWRQPSVRGPTMPPRPARDVPGPLRRRGSKELIRGSSFLYLLSTRERRGGGSLRTYLDWRDRTTMTCTIERHKNVCADFVRFPYDPRKNGFQEIAE